MSSSFSYKDLSSVFSPTPTYLENIQRLGNSLEAVRSVLESEKLKVVHRDNNSGLSIGFTATDVGSAVEIVKLISESFLMYDKLEAVSHPTDYVMFSLAELGVEPRMLTELDNHSPIPISIN